MMDGADSERVYDGFQQFHAFFALALRLAQDRKQWRERSRNYLQALLLQPGERRLVPLNVIRDNAPAHRGEAAREYLFWSPLLLSACHSLR